MKPRWLAAIAALFFCNLAQAATAPPEFLHEASEVFYASRYEAPNDINGDGLSDMLWFNADTNQFGYWITSPKSTNSDYRLGGLKTINVTPGYYIAGVSDFDGNGTSDIVWTSANRDIYLWTSNGSSFTSRFVDHYPAGWHLVGAGDINGDGHADLLWMNDGTCQFAYWLMNGSKRIGSAVKNIACGYHIAAIGHFTQSTRLDLLWTSNNHDIYLWIGKGSGFQSVMLGTYGANERIIEAAIAGDFGGVNVYTVDDVNAQFNQYEWQSYFDSRGNVTFTTFGLVGTHPVSAGSYLGTTGNFAGYNEAIMVWANDTENQASNPQLPGALSWYTNTDSPSASMGGWNETATIATYPSGWSLVGAHH